MYYEIHGEGFPLVMIQGLSENVCWWDSPLIKELSKNFKTILLDNRGVGRSDNPDGEISIELMAKDTLDLMDVIKIKRAFIIGHSMGGKTAMEIALNYPERVEKLILYSANCGGPHSIGPIRERTIQLLEIFSEQTHTRELVEEVMFHIYTEEFITQNPEFMKKKVDDIFIFLTTPYTFGHQIMASSQYDSYDKLKDISSPTLIIHGKKDIITPPENAEILANIIPGARLIYFKNNAHMIHTQEPEKFIKVVLDFFK
jgi:pimeloyl-ACP methyl ester carboxylesterase